MTALWGVARSDALCSGAPCLRRNVCGDDMVLGSRTLGFLPQNANPPHAWVYGCRGPTRPGEAVLRHRGPRRTVPRGHRVGVSRVSTARWMPVTDGCPGFYHMTEVVHLSTGGYMLAMAVFGPPGSRSPAQISNHRETSGNRGAHTEGTYPHDTHSISSHPKTARPPPPAHTPPAVTIPPISGLG